MRPRALCPLTLRASLFALIAAVLPGCSRSPKVNFHTLGAESHRAAKAPRAVSRFKRIGVGPITLPALLEQPGLVVRKDDYTVELSSTHEWAGSLGDELKRALTRYLRGRLPGVQVTPVPWETAQAPQVQIALTLDRFDGAPGGHAVLSGTWTLQNPDDGSSIAVKHVSMQQKVEGDAVRDLVQAQAQLVARLGEQMIRGLR